MKAPATLILACRESKLAVTQCELIKAALEHTHEDRLIIDIKTFRTLGDQKQNEALHNLDETGVFTRGIQEAVLAQKADVAVHSLKDLPSRATSGLVLACIPQREYPYDLLITTKDQSSLGTALITKRKTDKVPQKQNAAIIGTSSLRRQLFLKKAMPMWGFKTIRGNVQTRLDKLTSGPYDAVILAEAGLRRLGLITASFSEEGVPVSLSDPKLIAFRLPLKVILPAAAQGVLGVECRSRDKRVKSYFSSLHHQQTATLSGLERSVMRACQAGCHTPIGVHAEVQDDTVRLSGMAFHIQTASLTRMKLYSDLHDSTGLQSITRRMGYRFKSFLQKRTR